MKGHQLGMYQAPQGFGLGGVGPDFGGVGPDLGLKNKATQNSEWGLRAGLVAAEWLDEVE